MTDMRFLLGEWGWQAGLCVFWLVQCNLQLEVQVQMAEIQSTPSIGRCFIFQVRQYCMAFLWSWKCDLTKKKKGNSSN